MCMEFFGLIAKGMMAFADFIWGWPLLIGTSFVAVFLSIRLGFFQFAFFGHVMKNTFGKIFDKGSGFDIGCWQHRRRFRRYRNGRSRCRLLDVVHRHAGPDRQVLRSYPGPGLS